MIAHDELTVMRAAFEAGAAALVRKREIASQLLNAMDEVFAGRHYAPPSTARPVVPAG